MRTPHKRTGLLREQTLGIHIWPPAPDPERTLDWPREAARDLSFNLPLQRATRRIDNWETLIRLFDVF